MFLLIRYTGYSLNTLYNQNTSLYSQKMNSSQFLFAWQSSYSLLVFLNVFRSDLSAGLNALKTLPLPLSFAPSLCLIPAQVTADPFTLLHLFWTFSVPAISGPFWSGLLFPHQVESIMASCRVTVLIFISISLLYFHSCRPHFYPESQ